MADNPLRYPGGKAMLAEYIHRILYYNRLRGCRFVEPYAGSAAAGIDLLLRRSIQSLTLCEKDIMVYAFWACVVQMPDALCAKIRETPITIGEWRRQAHLRDVREVTKENLLDLGFAGLFFNRTNFSGILNGGPIGGFNQQSAYAIHCRFNKNRIIENIKRIAKYSSQMKVYNGDAMDFLESNKKRFEHGGFFIYLDPPYFAKGKAVYRHYYQPPDHQRLMGVIRQYDCPWLISYDDTPFVRGLYQNMEIESESFSLKYSCAGTKVRGKGRELLLSNIPLDPIKYEAEHGQRAIIDVGKTVPSS
jgi:DNA adenine methylase